MLNHPLEQQLKQLCLPTFAQSHVQLAQQCEQQSKTYVDYLSELTSAELSHRYQQRIARLLNKPGYLEINTWPILI